MFNKDMVKPLSVKEILTLDQDRFNSIRFRLTTNTHSKNDMLGTSKATLPYKFGITTGSGNYIVKVTLGNPKKDLSLIFDTDPIFEPAFSTTYSNISCIAPECSSLTFATENQPCTKSSSRCLYSATYGDRSFSVGHFGKDKFTLTSQDVIDDFYFGCGQDNKGLFRGVVGLLGLGPDKLSIVSQSADKYVKVFSICLPPQAS
ncbi:hypothetical protein OSB04_025690 [Centaurea solstitialis]|uniref:Peptidase A1 domain-containing protein n=1 Tax=Centaurea solstitialis TaxID=347529 RepID=A0AA38SP54_9ASTR|nr:hypothetical protein OSB04_025690 [Centaurea solstitialis]